MNEEIMNEVGENEVIDSVAENVLTNHAFAWKKFGVLAVVAIAGFAVPKLIKAIKNKQAVCEKKTEDTIVENNEDDYIEGVCSVDEED